MAKEKLRFSKSALLDRLAKKVIELEKLHGFDETDGYSQVENKGEEINREYGKYRSYLDLISEIESGSI